MVKLVWHMTVKKKNNILRAVINMLQKCKSSRDTCILLVLSICKFRVVWICYTVGSDCFWWNIPHQRLTFREEEKKSGTVSQVPSNFYWSFYIDILFLLTCPRRIKHEHCYVLWVSLHLKQQHENISLNTFMPLNVEVISSLPLKQTMVIGNIEATKFKIQQNIVTFKY